MQSAKTASRFNGFPGCPEAAKAAIDRFNRQPPG